MGFNEMKQKAFFVVSTLDKVFEKWRSYTQKALDLTTNSIVKTPILLKSITEFEKVKNDKRLVMLFIKNDCPGSAEIMKQKEDLVKKAWSKWITLKTCDFNDFKDSLSTFGVDKSPTMLIYKKWVLERKVDNFEEIMNILKEFKI